MNYFLTLLLLFCSSFLFSQYECGTLDPREHVTFSKTEIQEEVKRLQNPSRTDPRVFMLTIHIIQSNTGANGIKNSFVNAALAKMNEHYNPIGIEFKVCNEFRKINNSKYLETDPDEGLELTLLNNVENTINIYFIPQVVNSNDEGICGNARFPSTSNDRRRIFMDNDCVTNGSTLSHEMGHFFNLLHTHSTFYGEERVARIGCDSSGDGFCDTPADPRLSGDSVTGCVYTGNEMDAFGDSYIPDVNNIMSYAPKACRETFTEEQMAMISLTAAGSNSYHLESCSKLDFTTAFLNPGKLTLNNFEDFEIDFKILSSNVFEPTTVDYAVELINKNDNSSRSVINSFFEFSPELLEFSISEKILFTEDLFHFDEIRLSIDKEGVFDEFDEGNNVVSLELDHDYFSEMNQILYPNPTNDELSLYRKDNYTGGLKCLFFDISGKKVFEENINKESRLLFHKFLLNDLIPGTYILQISDEDDNVEILKFIRL